MRSLSLLLVVVALAFVSSVLAATDPGDGTSLSLRVGENGVVCEIPVQIKSNLLSSQSYGHGLCILLPALV